MNKRVLSVVLVFALFVSLSALFASPQIKSEQEKSAFSSKLVEIYRKYDTDEKSSSEYSLKRLMLSNYNGSDTYGAADWAFDKEHSFAVLQYESEEAAKQALELIKNDGITVEPDSKAKLNSTNKGGVYPAGSNALGIPSYISKFDMGRDDVIVAVIDTGVMYDHELMEGRFVSRGYDFSDDGRNDAYYDTSMSDSVYAHSTFVCGIIADNTPENVKLLPYKVVPFGSSEASNSAIVASIYDAVDKGASVINISMSTYSGVVSLKYAIQNAISKNVCVCASAGNKSQEIKYIYPAAIDGVITVSALESDMKTFASFSNYGSAVDFCAPGRSIVSACPYKSGGKKFTTNSGTSFSAPFIAAVCANIKSLNNAFTKDEVYNIICDFSTDLGNEGYDIYCGNGLPNLANMVYTDKKTYSLSIPEGVLDVSGNLQDFTAETQPWKLFADRILRVNIDDGVDEIGAYAFFNMFNTEFTMAQKFKRVGDYAFYSCKKIESFEFDENVTAIGEKAFGDLSESFCISGFRNTAAEVYTLKENISFIPLGCKHNYLFESFDPTDDEEGYTVYTCTACGDSYIGAYIEPPEYYEGECGMGVYWRFYTKNKILEIGGNGYMNSYSEENSVPWSLFMNKIRVVTVGTNVSYISDYILYNATNAVRLKIYSKTASLNDNTVIFDDESQSKLTVYAYDDSAAKDYLTENGIQYVSLGCGHSRNVEYYEDKPSCCFNTYGTYTCTDCSYVYKEYLVQENKGHYVSGSINTFGSDAIISAEVYVDNRLAAVTNSRGKYAVYPVLCGKHTVKIIKNSEIIESYEINVDRANSRNNAKCCYGDFDKNGYINAKDYAAALKNDNYDADILDYGITKNDELKSENYAVQELPHAVNLSNVPSDNSDYHRDFIAVIENYSEFEIKESGFIYGKNMEDEMLYLDKVGRMNSKGFQVKKAASDVNYAYEKVLKYGSTTKNGTLSARFYIIYTNGVKNFTYYSDVISYTYPD